MEARVKLYDWAPSPFCMKVRWVLRYKGLPFERLPALANFPKVRRRGGIGKVPALELDGRFLTDSTDIVYALEEAFPDRPVVPADHTLRARCHALEDWADEAIYFRTLYYHWLEPAGQRAARDYFARTLLGRLAFRPYLMRVERQLRGQGTGRKPPGRVRADLERDLDAIEAMLDGRDYLLDTEGPMLCDFALGAQLSYLTLAASMGEVLDARPAIAAHIARVRQTPAR